MLCELQTNGGHFIIYLTTLRVQVITVIHLIVLICWRKQEKDCAVDTMMDKGIPTKLYLPKTVMRILVVVTMIREVFVQLDFFTVMKRNTRIVLMKI